MTTLGSYVNVTMADGSVCRLGPFRIPANAGKACNMLRGLADIVKVSTDELKVEEPVVPAAVAVELPSSYLTKPLSLAPGGRKL